MPGYNLAEKQVDYNVSTLKLPPHSIQAEQSVLGGLMLDGSAWDQVADKLETVDFYRRDHRDIFDAIRMLMEENSPADVITVSEYLEKRNKINEVGGMAYLGELARNTPSVANIIGYANIVRERAVLRGLIQVGNEISSSGFNSEGRNSGELLDSAEQLVFSLAERGGRLSAGFSSISEVLPGVIDRIDMLFRRDDPITGVATGFKDLDERTSGLQSGDLIIIAGRPSMGKTALAMNIAEHAAIKSKLAVGIFSMEMSAEQLITRMLSSLGRIDQHAIRTGKLADADWPRITSAVGLLNETAIFIDDTPALTPMELRARCRRLKREHDLGLVVIDYLQLMQVPNTKENRATEISEISRTLKALARELKVPLIALSQLNRGLEQRPNKRPIMSDLRESGAIEQDADVILFIYRDEVYNEDSPDKGMAEIDIAKQRNGPIGRLNLTFLGKHTKFENFSGMRDDAYPP
uniref:Replicative DNA helicase n=1 Tax=Candidatus Kentrum sp. UNK TaxID=2126344 RepID=A0A451ANU4_9GAMM|nr:MAG: primary replicative DNA helicase [Candidatus Kentron sp. UNK]VFK72907.1 MAG: primary replicative DNA helicase [Candidatus Kentron sp. UNK]